MLWRFPRFIRHVKAEGADPTVVVRLVTFYQLNVSPAAPACRRVGRADTTLFLLLILVDCLPARADRVSVLIYSPAADAGARWDHRDDAPSEYEFVRV